MGCAARRSVRNDIRRRPFSVTPPSRPQRNITTTLAPRKRLASTSITFWLYAAAVVTPAVIRMMAPPLKPPVSWLAGIGNLPPATVVTRPCCHGRQTQNGTNRSSASAQRGGGRGSKGTCPATTDAEQECRPRESAESRHLSNSAAENNVLVDLPALLPVTEGELDLLERELLPFIGDILRPSR